MNTKRGKVSGYGMDGPSTMNQMSTLGYSKGNSHAKVELLRNLRKSSPELFKSRSPAKKELNTKE